MVLRTNPLIVTFGVGVGSGVGVVVGVGSGVGVLVGVGVGVGLPGHESNASVTAAGDVD